MGKSLPVKYRPQVFEDLCSQTNIVKILTQQVETKQFKHAYLFAGPSGTGKTTLARILALRINEYVGADGKTHSSEPIEIDAASNNGVDNIRQIIEEAHSRSLSGTYKIFILDEAHLLTNQSWNALLKTIEETPEYTIFMFCTTEYNKVPETIRNRCQQYFLERVPNKEIVSRLKYICNQEGFEYEDEGLNHIAKVSYGSVRQAISYLEYCSSYSKSITVTNVLDLLGDFSYDTYFNLINSIIDKDNKKLIEIVEGLFNSGKDIKTFVDLMVDFVLDLSKYTLFRSFDIIKIPSSYRDKLEYTINVEDSTKYFNHVLDKLIELRGLLKGDTQPKNTVEICLLQL